MCVVYNNSSIGKVDNITNCFIASDAWLWYILTMKMEPKTSKQSNGIHLEWIDLRHVHALFLFIWTPSYDVYVHNPVIYLNHIIIFEWYVVWCGSKVGYQNMIIILNLIVNIIGDTYMTVWLGQESSLLILKILIWAPKIGYSFN